MRSNPVDEKAPTEDQLAPPERASRLPRQSSARLLLLMLLICIVLAVVVNGLLFRDQWITKAPTDVLLACEGILGNGVREELLSRLHNGRLDLEQVEAVLNRHGVEFFLDFTSPHPTDLPLQCHLGYRLSLSKKTWQCDFESVEWLVDGERIEHAHRAASDGLQAQDEKVLSVAVGPLAKGRHKLSVSGTVRLTKGAEQATGGTSYLQGFQVSGEIEVTGFLRDYIEVSATNDEVEAVRKGLAATVLFHNHDDEIQLAIIEVPVPVPVIASVWVRPSGQRVFQRVCTFSTEAERGHTVWQRRMISLDRVEGLRVGGQIDVRLIPDLQRTFERRLKRCFGAIIDWEELPVLGPSDSESLKRALLQPRAPTRIDRGFSKEDPDANDEDTTIL